DLQRLAAAAADLVDRPDPARMAALRYYLRVVSAEIESHHHVEDEDVWPFLEAVAGDRTALVPLTEDHERLDPLLHRANELAARGWPTRSSWGCSGRSPTSSSGTSPTRSATSSRSSPS